MKKDTLDIVLPCYNPSEGWANRVLASIHHIRSQLPDVDVCLILVNDGSTSGIDEYQVQQLHESLPFFFYVTYESNKGKGFALRKGVEKSEGDYCIYTDLDFPYREVSLINLFHTLKQQNADIVSGIRDSNYYSNVPWFRRQVSKLLKLMNKTLFRIPTPDTQCGLKGFNKRGKKLFLQTETNRYLFDLEFIFMAANQEDISLQLCEVELKDDVFFSRLNLKVLARECLNFVSILLKR